MDCHRAIQIIESIIYKPGWKFEAYHCDRFENTINVQIKYRAPDFSKENAPEYVKMTDASGGFAFMIHEEMTELDLLHQVFHRGIMSVEHHEAREAFRIAPMMDAPFHPHTQRGMRQFGDPNADLMFGLA